MYTHTAHLSSPPQCARPDPHSGTYAQDCPGGPFANALLSATSGSLHATIEIPISGAKGDSPFAVAQTNKELEYTYFDDKHL